MLCSLHPRVSVVCAVNYILEGALQLELLEIQVGPLRCISRGSMDNHILEGALQLELLEIQVGPLRCINRGSMDNCILEGALQLELL